MIIDGRVYKVTESTRHTCSIDDYVHDCGVIWQKDPKRPVFDIYYHVILHASKLGEALRRELYDDAIHQIGRITMWLFSLVNKLQTTETGVDRVFFMPKPLSDIIWSKYPNCCPACFGRNIALPIKYGMEPEDWGGKLTRCSCLGRPADAETRNQKLTEEEKKFIRDELRGYARRHKPSDVAKFNLARFQEMFVKVFGANIFLSSIKNIGFHLLEEVGEIAEALCGIYTYKSKEDVDNLMRLNKVLELENEIADAFSWLFALAIKLEGIFTLPERAYKKFYPARELRMIVRFRRLADFGNIIWKTYGNEEFGVLGCRDDEKTVCECDIHLIYDENILKDLLPTLGKSV